MDYQLLARERAEIEWEGVSNEILDLIDSGDLDAEDYLDANGHLMAGTVQDYIDNCRQDDGSDIAIDMMREEER